MKNFLLLFSSAIITSCILTSCYNDKYDKLYPAVNTCDTTTITYSKDIVPIISKNCYSPGNGCHDAGGASTSGFDYTSYSGLIVNIADILNDINFTPTKGHNNMPKNGNQLAQCDINKITRWINEGNPNN